MNALDAAERLLADEGEPLHYKEITRRILAEGLWHTEGKTPDATVRARIGQEIKKKGEKSRFERTGPGIYGLRTWDVVESTVDLDAAKKIDAKHSRSETMSFTNAAEYVLEHYAD